MLSNKFTRWTMPAMKNWQSLNIILYTDTIGHPPDQQSFHQWSYLSTLFNTEAWNASAYIRHSTFSF